MTDFVAGLLDAMSNTGDRRVPGPQEAVSVLAHNLLTVSIDVSRERATQEDLRWWLTLAPTMEWTWAVTYAESAPHWYVVLGRTLGLVHDDYIRAGRVIRTFGEPGKFYSMTNLYLFTEDRSRKFWCMWGPDPKDEDATLINLAMAKPTYGEQRDVDLTRIRTLRLEA